MDFFPKPLIPNKNAKNIIASCEIGNIKPAAIDTVDEKIRHHADISICHLGGKRFVTSKDTYEYYVRSLENAEIICGDSSIKSPYPFDAAYCAAVFSGIAVANEAVTDKKLLELLKSEFVFVNVRQGYAKCNICPVSENAVITEDKGIHKALSPYVDVLLIRPGYVALKGYKYGFIGGAAGLIGPNTLYFNGRITDHPDCERILEFLEKYSVRPICNNQALTDVGSIIAVS